MNILVTGSRGFIGLNLLKQLKRIEDIKIIEFTRNSNFEQLENEMGNIDFIFHLAGEVRPKSDDDEFKKSNFELTKNLIDLIEKKNKKIPFLMASSVHAEAQKNAYGKTKRESEIYLEKYAKRNKVPVWIYRLPHVFGEGCKPNYNSVISTWIYNSIHDQEIVVFDREIPMTYVYVQDIVNEFMNCLNDNNKDSNISRYIQPKITYSTTLGEVVDLIKEFKNADNHQYPVQANNFKNKLFITFLDYLEKNV